MISRSGIEEANKHIQALNGRIQELENILKEQQSALTAKDSFIQTKIQELMAQDRKIKDLSENLKSVNEETDNQDMKIVSLKRDIEAKDLQILNLQKENEKMKSLVRLFPDLNAVVSKINMAHNEITGNTTDVKLQETTSDSNSVADDGNTDTFGHVIDHEDTSGKQQQFSKLAQSTTTMERIQKFSISEDDIDEDSINGSQFEKSPGKEFYL